MNEDVKIEAWLAGGHGPTEDHRSESPLLCLLISESLLIFFIVYFTISLIQMYTGVHSHPFYLPRSSFAEGSTTSATS